MTRTPPRLPRPVLPQRTFRTPPDPDTTFPASGFPAMKMIKLVRSSSFQKSLARRTNVGVSMTVSMRFNIRQCRSNVKHYRQRFISVILHKIDGLHELYNGMAGGGQVKQLMPPTPTPALRFHAGGERYVSVVDVDVILWRLRRICSA